MKLPNANNAIVDIGKLRDYCLDMTHPEGRHKARVFFAALGLTRADAEVLRRHLLAAARTEEAAPGDADQFGERFVIDFRFEHAGRAALLRSAWIILNDETSPRLTTCYVLRRL